MNDHPIADFLCDCAVVRKVNESPMRLVRCLPLIPAARRVAPLYGSGQRSPRASVKLLEKTGPARFTTVIRFKRLEIEMLLEKEGIIQDRPGGPKIFCKPVAGLLGSLDQEIRPNKSDQILRARKPPSELVAREAFKK